MSVKAIRMYQSEDGKVHPTLAAAHQYNAQQKVMAAVKTTLAETTPSMQMSLLHIDLVNNPNAAAKLRDQLNKVLDYHRNYGKLKKAK